MKKINILIREMGELYASETIYESLKNQINSSRDQIQFILAPYNSDFKLLDISQRHKSREGLTITGIEEYNKTGQDVVYGFNTDISGEYDGLVDYKLDIYELGSCKDPIMIDYSSVQQKGVVGNLRVKSRKMNEDFIEERLRILEKMSKIKFDIIPRHPIKQLETENIIIKMPSNASFNNTMGSLRIIYAQSLINIMGQLFSDIDREYDHSPMEPTQNTYAIGRETLKIHECYKELYNNNSIGLYKTINSFNNLPEMISELTQDNDGLRKRLKWKKERIYENKKKYLLPLLKIIYP